MQLLTTDDTIAAIATGQAAGGLGVIRISGSGAFEVADRVFKAASGELLCSSIGYRAHFGHVSDKAGWSDEAVALVFKAPHSYTGENVVELSCHGGISVTRMALNACLSAGARPAAAGEFTRRAFENGRISLTQAEAVMSVISAEGKQAALAAQSALEGRLAARTSKICDVLVGLAGKLAAWCDYPDDEDIPAVTNEQLVAELTSIEKQLTALVADGERVLLCQTGINTVICGKPNVGKSTIMNLLAGCEKSIVTDIPGTTRDVVEERIAVGDCILLLSDTAGIHDTNDKIETIGIQRAKSKLNNSALVLAVFDGSCPLDDEDRKLLDEVSKRPCVAVINKTDMPNLIDTKYITDKIRYVVSISALHSEGIAELEKAILFATQINMLDAAAGLIVTQRQQNCALRALDAVKEALQASRSNVTFDAIDVSICDAIDALLELDGRKAGELVVNEVFKNFCVGK